MDKIGDLSATQNPVESLQGRTFLVVSIVNEVNDALFIGSNIHNDVSAPMTWKQSKAAVAVYFHCTASLSEEKTPYSRSLEDLELSTNRLE